MKKLNSESKGRVNIFQPGHLLDFLIGAFKRRRLKSRIHSQYHCHLHEEAASSAWHRAYKLLEEVTDMSLMSQQLHYFLFCITATNSSNFMFANEAQGCLESTRKNTIKKKSLLLSTYNCHGLSLKTIISAQKVSIWAKWLLYHEVCDHHSPSLFH